MYAIEIASQQTALNMVNTNSVISTDGIKFWKYKCKISIDIINSEQ